MNRTVQEDMLRNGRALIEAQRIAHLGIWEWDLGTGGLKWSDEVYRIFGVLPGEFGATYEAFLASVHPDDRAAVDQAVKEALADAKKGYDLEHRVISPDGAQRVVHARGEVTFDPDRKPVRMFGTVHDITERKHTERSLEWAFEEIKSLREKLEAEIVYLREEIQFEERFEGIVGVSDPIKNVMRRIQQVADASTTVLLTGETGTGKGVFARALHEASRRRDKRFVKVNCAGLPPNLIESELFGREKGAFTGSTARQIGRFELADGGTIFLDEVGELSLELQAKLLKVIEDGEFERLGSPHPVKVDVRIVASTNRHLEEEIKKGNFRKDLFYRLNVFPVVVPPLRERKGDIPLLVRYYVEKFSKSHGRPVKKISNTAMKMMENYAWPGNVRELMNVVERAIIVSGSSDLRLTEQIEIPIVGPVQEKKPRVIESQGTKGLLEVERDHILKTLQETGWRVEGPKGAARFLGMNPSTLRARIKKLGIKRPSPR